MRSNLLASSRLHYCYTHKTTHLTSPSIYHPSLVTTQRGAWRALGGTHGAGAWELVRRGYSTHAEIELPSQRALPFLLYRCLELLAASLLLTRLAVRVARYSCSYHVLLRGSLLLLTASGCVSMP